MSSSVVSSVVSQWVAADVDAVTGDSVVGWSSSLVREANEALAETVLSALRDRWLPSLRGLLRRESRRSASAALPLSTNLTSPSPLAPAAPVSSGELRVPVALALTKLIPHLPQPLFLRERTRLVLRVCASLKSRDQEWLA